MADWIIFWVMAPLSILAAVAMVLARNAVHSALFLIVNFFTLAVFFLMLGSPFLFVVQIIVYAGAIMVLFLFVIMLLGVDSPVPLIRLGIGFAREQLPDLAAVNSGGNTQALARVLFNRYFFPFEVTSVLLIVAAIGAMLHGRRRIADEETLDAPARDGAVQER
jgi:NADH-quinone oxidoreductase subunit J